ncbi:MAG: hypothetical protein R3237_00850 [Nitrosopumilaceae archaeon]|nr:hypothetical protein [Nitrosopumilaceae archaeon]
MPHDDYFLASLIEFTQWIDGKEKTIAKYNNFDELPTNLANPIKNNSDSQINLLNQNWKILEINKDLRAHGKGIHVKVRLESL